MQTAVDALETATNGLTTSNLTEKAPAIVNGIDTGRDRDVGFVDNALARLSRQLIGHEQ